MRSLAVLLLVLSYAVFSGIVIAALFGIYTIIMNFGSGTAMLIAPTIFILVMGVMGLINTHTDFKEK